MLDRDRHRVGHLTGLDVDPRHGLRAAVVRDPDRPCRKAGGRGLDPTSMASVTSRVRCVDPVHDTHVVVGGPSSSSDDPDGSRGDDATFRSRPTSSVSVIASAVRSKRLMDRSSMSQMAASSTTQQPGQVSVPGEVVDLVGELPRAEIEPGQPSARAVRVHGVDPDGFADDTQPWAADSRTPSRPRRCTRLGWPEWRGRSRRASATRCLASDPERTIGDDRWMTHPLAIEGLPRARPNHRSRSDRGDRSVRRSPCPLPSIASSVATNRGHFPPGPASPRWWPCRCATTPSLFATQRASFVATDERSLPGRRDISDDVRGLAAMEMPTPRPPAPLLIRLRFSTPASRRPPNSATMAPARTSLAH